MPFFLVVRALHIPIARTTHDRLGGKRAAQPGLAGRTTTRGTEHTHDSYRH